MEGVRERADPQKWLGAGKKKGNRGFGEMAKSHTSVMYTWNGQAVYKTIPWYTVLAMICATKTSPIFFPLSIPAYYKIIIILILILRN